MPSLRHTAALAAVIATTAFGLGSGAHAETDPATERPASGCFSIADDKQNDGHLLKQDKAPYDADLDVQSVTLRTTATTLAAYVKVADLKAGPDSTDGHRFSVTFTFGGHVFAMSGSAYKNGTGAIRDGLAQTGQAGHTTQLGVDVPPVVPLSASDVRTDRGFKTSGLRATFDQTGNWVVFTLPIADVTRYAPAAWTGKLTAVNASATTDEYAVSSVADDLGAGGSWTIGDNKCFSVATKLTLSVAKFPATRNVTARLTTASGQALSGQAVTFLLNGKKYATLTTAGNGTATIRNIKPGFTVTAQFAPVPGYQGCSASTKI